MAPEAGDMALLETEKALVELVGECRKKVKSLERELEKLRAHSAVLYESFSVLTFPSGYKVDPHRFEATPELREDPHAWAVGDNEDNRLPPASVPGREGVKVVDEADSNDEVRVKSSTIVSKYREIPSSSSSPSLLWKNRKNIYGSDDTLKEAIRKERRGWNSPAKSPVKLLEISTVRPRKRPESSSTSSGSQSFRDELSVRSDTKNIMDEDNGSQESLPGKKGNNSKGGGENSRGDRSLAVLDEEPVCKSDAKRKRRESIVKVINHPQEECAGEKKKRLKVAGGSSNVLLSKRPHLNCRLKVIEALYTFEVLRQKSIDLEGARAAACQAKGVRANKRPDLRASKQMKEDGLRVNTTQCIGNVPGIEVGDRFWYRIEMVVVGLHLQLEAGISYISKKKSLHGVSLATSIVMNSSSVYQDDFENGEMITYTGQGGLSHRSTDALIITDQVLTLGNEALNNSREHSQPVRVIRGTKDSSSPTGELYTYIGLYKVMNVRYEKGANNMQVYKFDLRRLPGQPQSQPVTNNLGHNPADDQTTMEGFLFKPSCKPINIDALAKLEICCFLQKRGIEFVCASRGSVTSETTPTT